MRRIKKTKPKDIMDLLRNAPVNKTIGDNLIRAWHIINSSKYDNILCSISGVGQIVM